MLLLGAGAGLHGGVFGAGSAEWLCCPWQVQDRCLSYPLGAAGVEVQCALRSGAFLAKQSRKLLDWHGCPGAGDHPDGAGLWGESELA